MGPQYLHHIGGDSGPIETIDLSVREGIADILGRMYATHIKLIPMG